MFRVNKKGVAEVLSWSAGLIVIFILVLVAILAYNIGGLGKRASVDVTLSNIDYNCYDSLASQRVGAAFFMYDFASSEKGELLRRVYSTSKRRESMFKDVADVFLKMISYDYFVLKIDADWILPTFRQGFSAGDICGGRDDFALFYLSGGLNKYSNVGVLVRECKNV